MAAIRPNTFKIATNTMSSSFTGLSNQSSSPSSASKSEISRETLIANITESISDLETHITIKTYTSADRKQLSNYKSQLETLLTAVNKATNSELETLNKDYNTISNDSNNFIHSILSQPPKSNNKTAKSGRNLNKIRLPPNFTRFSNQSSSSSKNPSIELSNMSKQPMQPIQPTISGVTYGRKLPNNNNEYPVVKGFEFVPKKRGGSRNKKGLNKKQKTRRAKRTLKNRKSE